MECAQDTDVINNGLILALIYHKFGKQTIQIFLWYYVVHVLMSYKVDWDNGMLQVLYVDFSNPFI